MTNMTDEEPNEPTELDILPLPGGGTVTPETALAWLRDDFPPYLTVVCHVAAEGATPDVRNSACHLGLDLEMAHEACIRAVETGTAESFERTADPNAPGNNTLSLAQVCAGRLVMTGSTGPFEDAFDELAEELARRLGAPTEADEATTDA